MKALLIMPPFWDPVCVPLGIASLRAYAAQAGHSVTLHDLNLDPAIFGMQRRYFDLGASMNPRWLRWNIERNGTEVLAMHQVLFLHGRGRPDYPSLVREVLNMSGIPSEDCARIFDVAAFDRLFVELYRRIGERIDELLRGDDYDVVGCSLFNSTWPATLFILERVKAVRPSIRTVVGGPGPLMGLTASANEVHGFFDAHPCIDFFVVGEGEQAFLDILERRVAPRAIVSGPTAGEHGTPSRIDALPPPDYGELPVSRYLQLSVATSRGCPFECSFCAETLFWRGFSRITPSRAFQLVRSLSECHGRNSFYLCDSLANQVISPLTRDIAASGLPIKLDCYLRADKNVCDAERTRAWRRGGLVRARLGMESASQRILDAMVKMTTTDQMGRSLAALSEAGVLTSTLWIIGFPGETDTEFEETLRFVREYRSSIYQADAWLMQYHRVGLAGSSALHLGEGARPRYGPTVSEVLRVVPTMLEGDLPPPERFARLERFVDTMAKLEIPNPYSLFKWVEADRRWAVLGRREGRDFDSAVMAMNA